MKIRAVRRESMEAHVMPMMMMRSDDDNGLSCRFSFPHVLDEESVLSIIEIVIRKTLQDQVKKTRFELHSRCNDRWLNSYIRPIMEVWRANMDMRLTVDVGKIIDYMTKYVTKAETILRDMPSAM
jgi:hypothetical protein